MNSVAFIKIRPLQFFVCLLVFCVLFQVTVLCASMPGYSMVCAREKMPIYTGLTVPPWLFWSLLCRPEYWD